MMRLNSLRFSTKVLSRLLFVSLFLSSCAFFKANKSQEESSNGIQTFFDLVDSSGSFVLEREAGLQKKENSFVVKRRVFVADNPQKELEKSIAISETGHLKNKVKVFRPKVSQYSVWFEGKKFFTEMKVDVPGRSLLVKMESPEPQWNGEKRFPFPHGTGLFCFFSQVVECAKTTGFFALATKNDVGQLNFHIIWEGYPYFGEQYLNIPDEPITQAKLVYDGKNEDGERRFSLYFGEQVIFLLVDANENISKMFWVSQGFQMIRRAPNRALKKVKK